MAASCRSEGGGGREGEGTERNSNIIAQGSSQDCAQPRTPAVKAMPPLFLTTVIAGLTAGIHCHCTQTLGEQLTVLWRQSRTSTVDDTGRVRRSSAQPVGFQVHYGRFRTSSHMRPAPGSCCAGHRPRSQSYDPHQLVEKSQTKPYCVRSASPRGTQFLFRLLSPRRLSAIVPK